MEQLGKELIQTDWQQYVLDKKTTEGKRGHAEKSNDSVLFHLGITRKNEEDSRDSMDSNSKSINADHCTPLVPKSYFTGCKITDKKRICQICTFEGRGRKLQNVAFCAQHHVRACLEIHPDHTKDNQYYNYSTSSYQPCYDWSWMCNKKSLSCWDKLHEHYLPRGLFTKPTNEISPDKYDTAHIKKSHPIYKMKKQALRLAAMGVQETSIEVPNIDKTMRSNKYKNTDDESDSDSSVEEGL